MKTEVQHSPTPWKMHDMERAIIVGLDHGLIAHCVAFRRPMEENDENALFIVKAVNAHNEIVEASQKALRILEKLLDYYEANPQTTFTGAYDIGFVISDLKAALKLAGEE